MDRSKVQIFPLAVAKIIKHSASHPNTEIAGFLIGFLDGDKIIITDTRTGRQTGNTVHVSINDMELARIADELDDSELDEKIVGWYHSHPNMGAHFFSSTDIATQKRYQMFLPQSVGFVIDPAEYIRSRNPNIIDLKCWKVFNNKSVRFEYDIIIDSTACLKNLLTHFNYEPDVNRELTHIIQDLLPQLEVGIDIDQAMTRELAIEEEVNNRPLNQENYLKVTINIIILTTFLFFVVMFMSIL